MLAENIQSLLNLFNFCTFQVFRNYSADLLSPSLSLSDHLILTQSNPIILENLDDTSFTNHRYFSFDVNNYKNKSVYQLAFNRSICRILLVDFDTISKDIWRNSGKVETGWKSWIIFGLLHGLGGFQETPNFIIFQDSHFSEQLLHVSFFAKGSHTFAVNSPRSL